MTVTRHPLFTRAGGGLTGLPTDWALADRLRKSFLLLPRGTVPGEFLEFLRLERTRARPMSAEEEARLTRRLDGALASLILGCGGSPAAHMQLRRLGLELRRCGFGRSDVPRLAALMTAALLRLADGRWHLSTMAEWAQTTTLLFEAALDDTGN